jgi:hypothetical protein
MPLEPHNLHRSSWTIGNQENGKRITKSFAIYLRKIKKPAKTLEKLIILESCGTKSYFTQT